MDNERKPITIYDIAQKANVSVATVSRVLNDFKGVSTNKRKIVLDIIEKLNFTPNSLAQSLSNQKTNTIGMIIPDITNEYFSSFVNEFELVASKHQYTVILGNSHSNLERESELLQIFKQKRVEAIFFMGGRIDSATCPTKYIKELIEINKEIPVFLGSKIDNVSISHVYLDFDNVAEKTVLHLKEQGCKTAGIIGGTTSINISNERKNTFEKYFMKHDILVKREWIIEGGFTKVAGINAINKLINLPEMPDAIFCMNDLVAVGALYCASKNNISVPEDLMIVGFDGVSLSKIVFPEITTIQYDFKKCATKVFEAINDLMNGRKTSIDIILKPKLVIRDSTNRLIK